MGERPSIGNITLKPIYRLLIPSLRLFQEKKPESEDLFYEIKHYHPQSNASSKSGEDHSALGGHDFARNIVARIPTDSEVNILLEDPPNYSYSEFGIEAREIMLLKNTTLSSIAKELGVSLAYVSKILKGTRSGGKYRNQIAVILGMGRF